MKFILSSYSLKPTHKHNRLRAESFLSNFFLKHKSFFKI